MNKEEENLNYNEEITSRGNEELEKIQRVENEAQTSKALVKKEEEEEEESTSPESHDKTNDEVVKTIPKMDPSSEMREELKKEKMTPILKAGKCTIQLFKEMEATIVNKKIKNIENIKKNNDLGRLCAHVVE